MSDPGGVPGPLTSLSAEGRRVALVWNGTVAIAPTLVVQPTSAHGVVEAVKLARDLGLLVRVRGEERSDSSASSPERTLTLDLTRLHEATPSSPAD